MVVVQQQSCWHENLEFGGFPLNKTITTRWSGQVAELKCCLSENCLESLFQEAIEGFECKMNGLVLGVTLRQSFPVCGLTHSLLQFASQVTDSHVFILLYSHSTFFPS